jgi:predicted metal-dependent hydrolase
MDEEAQRQKRDDEQAQQQKRDDVQAQQQKRDDEKAQQQKRRDVVRSSLDMTIKTLDLAKVLVPITAVKAVFGSVSLILGMIRVSFLLVRFD